MQPDSSAVVHVVVAGEIGGAERMLVDLCAAAAGGERACSIALMTPNEELRALFQRTGIEIDDRGAGVKEGPLPFLKSTLGGSDKKWLLEVLAKRRAGIVHLHTFASQVVGTRAALDHGAKVVRTEHSTRVYDDPSCWPFSRWSLERTHAVVCISDHVKRVMMKKAGLSTDDRRVSVIHNGVDTEKFAPAASERSDDRVRFVALGRLDPRKGLDLALEAMTKVPEGILDIVGDGEARGDLEKRTKALRLEDRVRFVGYREDVRESIAAADVLISSAKEEGLGVALLEGMSMGKPVVAVPVGGILEIVREGETGWLADVRSADALARAMTQSIASGAEERSRRGARARQRTVDNFSVASMRSAYESVYKSLAS
jgi:L-malate glycosyltransferase